MCSLRLEVSKEKLDDKFTLEEVERAISELKQGKCSDPTGLTREVFTWSGKCMISSIFLMRGVIDRAKYLKQEVWFTFYDIEKCFDSLWLGDCLNSLWKNGVQNDIFCLIYLINKRSNITVKTPFGDTYSFLAEEIVKQGTVLGPILNDCSLDDVCKEGKGYQYGSVELKPFEFVDDIAEPNRNKCDAQISNKVITGIQELKKLKFSFEKCKVLKINSSSNTDTLFIEDRAVDIENSTSYLGWRCV